MTGEQKDLALELASATDTMATSSRETLRSASVIGEQASAFVADVNAVASTSETMAGLAQSGAETVKSVATSVSVASSDLDRVQSEVAKLAEHATEIDAIVGVIKKFASSTNLLSLNAAIEAARVGEAGRGFGVVATEVKSLAESTNDSLRGISELVERTEAAVRSVVEATGAVTASVATSSERATEAAADFDQILENVNITDEMISTMVAATWELAASSAEIRESAESVSELAETVVNLTSELTTHSPT